MQKPASLIFAEFEGKAQDGFFEDSDVKYHLGYSTVRKTKSGHEVHLSLMFNPSHLEAVNPVVLGSVRARQHRSRDQERKKNIAILIHGDAAFMGQGVVAETLNMMNLEAFDTGGTIHIITNNQIGYRRLGHNETDEPVFTQPEIFNVIRKHAQRGTFAHRHAVLHDEKTGQTLRP